MPDSSGTALPPCATAFFQGRTSKPAREVAGGEDDVIEVLPINWPAVQVYLDCQWTMHFGLSQVYYQGISTVEINAAMFAHCIPRAKYADTLRRIRIMVSAARPILNSPSS